MYGVKFRLGNVYATPGAIEALTKSGQSPLEFLARHQSGDWGDCDKMDKKSNDLALLNGSRIFSVYHTKDGEKLWLITEWDRSSTTILLPEEY